MTTRWIWMRWTPAATTIFLWTRKAVWTTVFDLGDDAGEDFDEE